MYPEALVSMIESELTEVGFIPFNNAQQVADHFENHSGTTLLVVNSMCGCAGPDAREGVIEALAGNAHAPDHLVTIFPGVNEEAVAKVQQYVQPYPLSSPAIALIQNGVVVYFMERHQIKGRSADEIASDVVEALATYC
eukprot:gene36-50_t